jgi:glycerol-3-phosphate dehydrogenase
VKVSVFGGGPWGLTLAAMLARAGKQPTLWSTSAERRAQLQRERTAFSLPALPEAVTIAEELEEALVPELVFVALRPSELRDGIRAASRWLRPAHVAVHLSRGIEPGGDLLSDVM